MSTLFIAVTIVPNKKQATSLGLAMEHLHPAPVGMDIFEIEDGSDQWEVGGYFTDSPDDVALAVLAMAFEGRPFAISQVPDVDWVAKVRRELAPVEAGRFFVYGSHDAHKVPAERIALLVEASMAFGTGHHGTTRGCLVIFEQLLSQGHSFDKVLDLGCGTAVLAMAAARALPSAQVLASDIDPVAVEVAQANVQANNMTIPCVAAVGFNATAITDTAPFDLIFANILKGPLMALAPDMALHCRKGGRIILSGLLCEQADGIANHYGDHGFDLDHCEDFGEWTVLRMTKAA